MNGVCAITEKMFFHLPRQVLAGTGVGQIEAVFIDQHGLLLHPVGPGLFADFFPDAFAESARVRGEIQTFSFFAEHDALNETCHE